MTTRDHAHSNSILIVAATPSVPNIEPISQHILRPRWSVMIPTYNCARFLQQTLESVLAQDPGGDQMQIEVVDDCSTSDDPKAIVDKIGKGRVSFFRQPRNIGPTANFNTCLQRSRGFLVHILHGDDYVSPGFYNMLGEQTERRPELAFFHARSLIVDETGELDTVTPRTHALECGGADASSLYYSNPLRAPGVVVRRSFYEKWGGFDEQLVHVADWEMFVRAVTFGGGITLNRLLAAYRYFPWNHTSQVMQTGENLRDCLRMAETWLVKEMPGFSMEIFRTGTASQALHQADYYRRTGNQDAAIANLEVWNVVATKRMRILHWARRVTRCLL